MTATGYSLAQYGNMITCEPRMGAFAEAMRRAITPGCRVLEIGTGPGIMAIMACQMGAGHVVAIESDPSIEIARRLAAANGCADRITFVRDLSTNWQPDAPADVVISDIRGVLPLFEHHVSSIVDVRARLLQPGGTQIPRLDRIRAALVAAPAEHEKFAGPWLARPYGVDMAIVHSFAINDWGRVHLPAAAVQSTVAEYATLDYRTITQANHSADMDFVITGAGTIHGLLMWSETELVPGIGHSNAPGEPEQVYGQAFFPLERPVDMAEGAQARVGVSSNLIDGQYIWSWSFSATDARGVAHSIRQSSFKGQIPDPVALGRRAATHCPPPSQKAAVDVRALSLFDGQTDLAGIAACLRREFPAYFVTDKAALDHVASLSSRYAKS